MRPWRATRTSAAVGPMFLYPDGRVQEVGGLALPTGDVVQVGKGAVWGPDHYDTPCAVDFCSAACLMMRRSDFLEVGGFGFEWEPAYYEDADLCLKLWTRCGKVMVNPAARVIHIESKTTSSSQLQLHNISEINRARFVAKWGPWLEARQGHSPSDLIPRTELAVPARCEAIDPHQPRAKGPMPRSSSIPRIRSHPEAESASSSSWRRTSRRLFGTARVAIATPHRYSTTRLRQIAGTFGFDHVVGTPVPWAEIEPENCRFSVVLGNTILPPTHAFGEYSVYQLQFPFWVPDQEISERGSWLGEFDEIWVYSEFVRRHVNGLVRHYGLAAPPHPGDHATRRLASRRGMAGPGTNAGRSSRSGGSSPAATTSARTSCIEAFRRILETGMKGVELALAGAIHPSPAGRARFYELQQLAEGLPCSLHPNIGRRDLATPLRALGGLDPCSRFRRRPRRVPGGLGALRDHPDRSSELRVYSGRLRPGWAPGGHPDAGVRYGVLHRRGVRRHRHRPAAGSDWINGVEPSSPGEQPGVLGRGLPEPCR